MQTGNIFDLFEKWKKKDCEGFGLSFFLVKFSLFEYSLKSNFHGELKLLSNEKFSKYKAEHALEIDSIFLWHFQRQQISVSNDYLPWK